MLLAANWLECCHYVTLDLNAWRFTLAELTRVQVQREVIHYTSFVSLIEIERPLAIMER